MWPLVGGLLGVRKQRGRALGFRLYLVESSMSECVVVVCSRPADPKP